MNRLLQCFLILCTLAPARAEVGDDPRREATVDTEHIFGFTEGADIGRKGELELENTTTGLLGKPGSFAALNNETALRYGIADGFRVSFAPLTDYHDIRNVPGLADRTALSFTGLSSQFRWQVSEHENAAVGLTFSFAPEWRRIDPQSGQPAESCGLPLALLADTARGTVDQMGRSVAGAEKGARAARSGKDRQRPASCTSAPPNWPEAATGYRPAAVKQQRVDRPVAVGVP